MIKEIFLFLCRAHYNSNLYRTIGLSSRCPRSDTCTAMSNTSISSYVLLQDWSSYDTYTRIDPAMFYTGSIQLWYVSGLVQLCPTTGSIQLCTAYIRIYLAMSYARMDIHVRWHDVFIKHEFWNGIPTQHSPHIPTKKRKPHLFRDWISCFAELNINEKSSQADPTCKSHIISKIILPLTVYSMYHFLIVKPVL
jgi:hypothetical protein